jgi:hypothetical protein
MSRFHSGCFSADIQHSRAARVCRDSVPAARVYGDCGVAQLASTAAARASTRRLAYGGLMTSFRFLAHVAELFAGDLGMATSPNFGSTRIRLVPTRNIGPLTARHNSDSTPVRCRLSGVERTLLATKRQSGSAGRKLPFHVRSWG